MAKDIVKGAKRLLSDQTQKDVKTKGKAQPATGGLVFSLEGFLEDLDVAIDAKQRDVVTEGPASLAENHYRLGILTSAAQLIRRAHALLEDYDAPLAVKDKSIIEAAFARLGHLTSKAKPRPKK